MMRKSKMHTISRLIAGLLTLVFLLAALPSCSFSSEATTSQEAKASSEAVPAPETEPATTSEAELLYKGYGSEYVYVSSDPRDREWEEDIVYFANHFLNPDSGHPKLIGKGCTVNYLNDFQNGYAASDGRYESLYDPVLYEEFIQRINDLLLTISEKSESELRFGCAEAAAILRDGHTAVALFDGKASVKTFPIDLLPIYTDGVPEAYIYAAPEGMEELLLCRLDTINGVPVSKILESASRLISHESMTWVYACAFPMAIIKGNSEKLVNPILCDEILRYIGVMGQESTAVFSLTDRNGEMQEIEMACTGGKDYPQITVYHPPMLPEGSKSIGFDLRYSKEEEVWFALIDGGKALYIRFNSCPSDADKTVREAAYAAKKADSVDRVILDFRSNSGGDAKTYLELMKLLNALDAPGGKYVLIDSGSYSAAVSLSTRCRRFCENVVLVGEPAGMPPNGGFAGTSFFSPNHHLVVGKALLACYYTWPGNDDPALMPDILVYQTLEDYQNGIDTVMNYILNGGANGPAQD